MLKEIEPYLENFETFCLECDFLEEHFVCSSQETKSEGVCHLTDCPYCETVSFADLKKFDLDLYEEWKEEPITDGISEENLMDEDTAPLPYGFGCDWVVVYYKEEPC